VPLAVGANNARRIRKGRTELGVWLPSDARPGVLKMSLARFLVVAVDFREKFADGRGHSIAYNLRARLGYARRIARAIGDVLRVNLFYMSPRRLRCIRHARRRNIHVRPRSDRFLEGLYQTSLGSRRRLCFTIGSEAAEGSMSDFDKLVADTNSIGTYRHRFSPAVFASRPAAEDIVLRPI
jgi:uncharacterized protein (DUF934 family)